MWNTIETREKVDLLIFLASGRTSFSFSPLCASPNRLLGGKTDGRTGEGWDWHGTVATPDAIIHLKGHYSKHTHGEREREVHNGFTHKPRGLFNIISIWQLILTSYSPPPLFYLILFNHCSCWPPPLLFFCARLWNGLHTRCRVIGESFLVVILIIR